MRSVGLIAVVSVATVSAAMAARPATSAFPPGFVYVSAAVPTILTDIRYAGAHNFLGYPVPGYRAPACVLTQRAAAALAKAQAELVPAGLSFRVYDCYRPQRAVDAFLAWSKRPADQSLKAEYYPRVNKSQLFALGYLTARSEHTRGSAVDLTIERLPPVSPAPWVRGTHTCIAPYVARYHDGSIDMGTNFDCLDPLSRADASVGGFALTHRAMLRDLMEKYGFRQSARDPWWHFVLRSEPFPNTYFDFPVTSR